MTVTSICPDDLIALARGGSLGAEDEARLAVHLERCALCRVALEVGRDFDIVLEAQAGDEAIANRIASGLAPRPFRRVGAYAGGLALLLTGSLAVASAQPTVWRWIGNMASGHAGPKPTEVRSANSVAEPRDPKKDARFVQDLEGETEHPDAPTAETEPSAPSRSTTKPPRIAPSTNVQPSAKELFAEANSLRTAGKSAEAEKRYAELQARYPGTSEARVSLLSLGRLKLGSRPGEALRHFDAYLGQKGHTTLAEEALFGRARALGQLGQTAQERAAWQRLLERFPSSVYAEQAKARLSKIP
jgi:tetratricopeptide (TPR) repeat protein